MNCLLFFLKGAKSLMEKTNVCMSVIKGGKLTFCKGFFTIPVSCYFIFSVISFLKLRDSMYQVLF